VIEAYRTQSEAEFSFRPLKDPHLVSFSPMHHGTDHKADSSDHANTALANKSSKTSIGLRQFNVLRGLPFNSAATLSSSSCECKDRSVPLGKYWR